MAAVLSPPHGYVHELVQDVLLFVRTSCTFSHHLVQRRIETKPRTGQDLFVSDHQNSHTGVYIGSTQRQVR